LNFWGRLVKRSFDIVASLIGIVLTLPIMLVAFVIASIETRSFGLFLQDRVGQHGKLFKVFKIKTMKKVEGVEGTVTVSSDLRITKSGKFLRDKKIDELPQFFNVLFGSMSFVGPRPDVEGYADRLEGDDRIVLSIRPAITGPASLKYKNEEEILANQENPKEYNDNIIWWDKVSINREYIENWSFIKDMRYIVNTVKR
jgi:lipopolysaccharide/colanic/teichoic acid biosynthesis glycosyltransferase